MIKKDRTKFMKYLMYLECSDLDSELLSNLTNYEIHEIMKKCRNILTKQNYDDIIEYYSNNQIEHLPGILMHLKKDGYTISDTEMKMIEDYFKINVDRLYFHTIQDFLKVFPKLDKAFLEKLILKSLNSSEKDYRVKVLMKYYLKCGYKLPKHLFELVEPIYASNKNVRMALNRMEFPRDATAIINDYL